METLVFTDLLPVSILHSCTGGPGHLPEAMHLSEAMNSEN